MTLRLRIVSDHRRLLGDRSSVVFSMEGGTIGRSADNDWVLPDPMRYVSAHHARIQFRDGHYYLEDVSTNGVFVNDDERPLAKSGSDGHLLRNGDIVRMGDYQIVAAIDATTEQVAVPTVDTGSGQVPTSIHALRTLGRATAQTDIGAMLNLDDLLVPDPSAATDTSTSSSGEALQPVNAYGQAIAQAPRPLTPSALAARAPTAEEEEIDRRIARLARAAGRDPRNGTSSPALFDVHSGLQAFCRGAGIESEKLPADAQTRMLHLAGQLFREALVAFKELDRTRKDSLNRYRIELTTDPEDPRPSLERATVDDVIIDLFLQHESRRLDAVGWLREAVAQAKTHETAFERAMRAAFVEFLDRLDPAELEARFERAARRGKAKSADKAQYWELFTTFYRNLIEMPADHLPHTFVEAFAAAYREHLRKATGT
ncbi:MAG TPA: type VI secretion system-associated FHA domain protein TagH [Steroidobacteraceae bacterium]|nr:type VI secretion system-associated FHA domain protein TagH [Steroidobacteraceae bacterium]